MERTMHFTITVTVPADLADATSDEIANEIENMISNNSDMSARVDPAEQPLMREPTTARQPVETRTRVGDASLWRTDILGAAAASRSCATCGGTRRLSVFTLGEPTGAPNWWAGQPLHCSVRCWTQGA